MISSIALLVVATIFVNCSFAANGDIDGRVHQYAGFVTIPKDVPATLGNCTYPALFAACSGSLVNIPGFPARRMFVTARHCALYRTKTSLPFRIQFGDDYTSTIVRDPSGSCGASVVGWQSTPTVTVYDATYVWYPAFPDSFDPSKEIGIGTMKDDYALILLDSPVSVEQVDLPAVIFNSSDMSAVALKRSLPVVGTAGYGFIGYGSKLDGPGGKPVAIRGNRTKKYVELDVVSVQPTNINAVMNAAQLEDTLCSGDSGAAAIRPEKVTGVYNIYGVVTAGDTYCRATNTYTRVGTTEYYTFLDSIQADVLAKVALLSKK